MSGMTASGTVPSTPELEALAVSLADGAARVVAAGRGGELTVSAKTTSTDLVTQVDRQTEAWLVEQIRSVRPDDAVLGEEGGERVGSSPVRWLIDPIDGTVNFVLGIAQYAVSVAAEVEGTVVAGAVANPASGETFHARRGGGAWLGERRLTGPRDVPLSRAVVATGFGYDPQLRSHQAAVAARLLPQVSDIRRLGSAALDLCFLAAGRVDGYYEAGLNPWDYAAGLLIASEAGCVVGGLDGRGASRSLTVGAGPALADELFAVLATLGAEWTQPA
jgi:myo-inositol-1(or 4)-monophosphatase